MAITSCWRSQSRSVVSSSGLQMDRPALLTTRSTPPNASAAAANASRDRVGVGDVGGHAIATSRSSLARRRSPPRPSRPSASRSATTTQAPSAASRWAMARPMPDAGAGDERDPGGERFRLRASGRAWPPPAPSTRCGTSPPRRSARTGDRLGAAHHVDRVDVELAGDPGGLLVGTEGEHADAGHAGRSPGLRRASPASRRWRCAS